MKADSNKSDRNLIEDPKAKMLAALEKKQKRNLGKSIIEVDTGSKIGVGQKGGVAPKMHRRKSGSA